MTARSGMATLITQLRSLTNAGTLDYSIGTANFWDGDQLQDVLDRHRSEVYREPLEMYPTYSGGSALWYEYRSKFINLETTTGGTAIFIVEDATGNDQGTALWSADYARGIITFVSNTLGTAYYLTARAYDLYAAAADVWRAKAAYFADQFDFSTDNHSVSRNQKYKSAMAMAESFDQKAGANGSNIVTMYRSDVVPGGVESGYRPNVR